MCSLRMAVSAYCVFFFFKQKTAYEMRISDWSSDVCSSDLLVQHAAQGVDAAAGDLDQPLGLVGVDRLIGLAGKFGRARLVVAGGTQQREHRLVARDGAAGVATGHAGNRSEERRGGKECGSTGRSRWATAH